LVRNKENIPIFLTPKSEVAYIYDDYTMRQTLEKMEYHRYSSIPIINKKGEYVGTMTEGDLLWSIKNDFDLNLKSLEDICISSVRRKMDNKPISVNANIEDLVEMKVYVDKKTGAIVYVPKEEPKFITYKFIEE
jgi:CBS domain-containing protein